MTEEEHRALLKRLERLLNEKEPERLVIFTQDEAKALRSIIQRELGWIAIGKLAGSSRAIMTWIGIAVGTWALIKAGLLDWLKSNL